MAVSVDHSQAQQILLKALAEVKSKNYNPCSLFHNEIAEVILGNHLTYRYILITNLLGKSVNSHVHSLALQAGAQDPGAYDARSLCHKVLVPFERNYLAGKLGRSNEPFLNKPARYTELSKENPVRGGYDTNILNKSIHVLSNITDSDMAFLALKDALYFTLQRDSLIAEVREIAGTYAILHSVLYNFGRQLLTKSIEGETSAILTGLAFAIQAQVRNIALDIYVHPVNQAGSSSNEILDVDVYENNTLFQTAEVKDKPFTFEDVDHAARKVQQAGFNNFLFLLGPQCNISPPILDTYTNKIAKNNVKVSFINVFDFYLMMLGYMPTNINAEYIWQKIEEIMKTARVKDLTRQHVFESAKTSNLIK